MTEESVSQSVVVGDKRANATRPQIEDDLLNIRDSDRDQCRKKVRQASMKAGRDSRGSGQSQLCDVRRPSRLCSPQVSKAKLVDEPLHPLAPFIAIGEPPQQQDCLLDHSLQNLSEGSSASHSMHHCVPGVAQDIATSCPQRSQPPSPQSLTVISLPPVASSPPPRPTASPCSTWILTTVHHTAATVGLA